jgi:hypothetical protein
VIDHPLSDVNFNIHEGNTEIELSQESLIKNIMMAENGENGRLYVCKFTHPEYKYPSLPEPIDLEEGNADPCSIRLNRMGDAVQPMPTCEHASSVGSFGTEMPLVLSAERRSIGRCAK